MKLNRTEVQLQMNLTERPVSLDLKCLSEVVISSELEKVLKWDEHTKTAFIAIGRSGSESVNFDREGRW
jgi:hypothetical protein